MAAALLAATPVQAVSPQSAASGGPQDLTTLATTLQDSLGDRSAGSYLDEATGKLTVTVTDASTAQAVRAAGAVPRTVTRSGAELRKVKEDLDRSARIPGTAWAADPISNQVVISIDETVKGTQLAKLQTIAEKHGSAVRIEKIAGQIGTVGNVLRNGEGIRNFLGITCSIGFNVQDLSGAFWFLTAGHCLARPGGPGWFNGATFLGSAQGYVFSPAGDWGAVRYEAPNLFILRTVAGTNLSVTASSGVIVGQNVKRSGTASGVHSGMVTATNVTVNYTDATVFGLIKTTVCASPGDSGGPLFRTNPQGVTLALGITSGAINSCSSGGTVASFYQPISPILASGDFRLM